MKKLLAVILTVFMAATMVPVWAAVPETTVPESWELIAEADFTTAGFADTTGDEILDFDDYTPTGGVTSWSHTISDADRTDTNSNGNGLYIGARSDASNTVKAILENPIDLSTDGDYYLIYTSDFNGGGKQNANCILKRELIYTNTNDSRDERKLDNFHFSASDGGAGKYMNVGYSYQAKNPETGGDYAWGGKTRQSSSTTGYYVNTAVQTMVGQLSVRDGKVIQRARMFKADETPTFSPDYWDIVTYNSPTWRPGDDADKKLDILEFSYGGNSGHVTGPRIQGFKLYKAPAVNSYVLSDNNSDSTWVPYVGTTITVKADNTLTDSIVWYDVTGETPVEIATGAEYTVPASMCGKKIKAIVTTTAGEKYDAVAGTVHNTYEISALSAKVTSTDGFNVNDYSTYTNATSIAFDATVQRLGTVSINKTYALITAQYSKDGMLKSVQTSKANNKLNDFWTGGTNSTGNSGWVRNTFTFDHENMNYAPGDYFNCYVWVSSSETSGEYVHDALIPLTVYPEKLTSISQTVFTIPDIAE